MGLDMIEAEEMRILSSMMDGLQVLKKRIEDMEAQIQTLVSIHRDSSSEIREDYLQHLDELDEEGQFEEFSSIEELRRRIEEEER
jgi:hypothetical protein